MRAFGNPVSERSILLNDDVNSLARHRRLGHVAEPLPAEGFVEFLFEGRILGDVGRRREERTDG